ncbi:MAG: transglutaminase domain-containing protein [Candidatus Shapirobacteria bacterium]
MKKLALILFFFLLFSRPAKAIDEFNTNYQIDYTIDNRGLVTASQQISLTNNMANIYPKEYIIETSQKVSNISAWDQQGDILKQVSEEDGKTKIGLSFNQEIVGKGKSFVFNIKYQLKDPALRKGRVWEVSLPGFSSLGSVDSLTTTITVPNSFGKLAYSSVKIAKAETLETKTKFSLDSSSASQPAILSFGDFQSFNFSLSYQLENPDDQTWQFSVAIPPITNYQETLLTDLRPLPERVEVDENGNWLAIYLVEAKNTLPVLVEGQAKVFAIPQAVDSYNLTDKLDLFLKEQKYWPISSPKITDLAQSLKTADKIYQYVVSHLSYNYQALSGGAILRSGALFALANPNQAVCSEFTDLFVTLSRAAKIPAREIEGFAYTTNPKLKPVSLKKDVLHAWPEYWDFSRLQWIQVDPTWEKTTGGVDYFDHFDFNHLAFVIHGTQSDFPPPPGSYTQSSESTSKNIQVSLANKEVPFPPDQELLEKLDLRIVRENKQSYLLLKNNSFFPLKKIQLNDQTIDLLAPLATKKISASAHPFWQQFLLNPKLNATLKLASLTDSKIFYLHELSPSEQSIRLIMLVFISLIILSLTIFFLVKIITKVAKRS